MTVYLVGAGPGDPGLLTVRGAELLRRADVVIHDRLADPSLLELAPARAERVDVGKAPGGPVHQDDIDRLLVEAGRSGRCVVRLKGGDPFVFGRGGEEALALIDAGIPFEVVPGITSAVAVPAYAGVPVTHRGLSTAFTVVTGHTRMDIDADINWEALAQVGGTLVVLMGVAHRDQISARLQAGGLAASTPVAAVQWGTRPEQHTVRTTLAELAAAPISPPATIVIGAVAGLDLAWFVARPLFGRRVVITRARDQASRLASMLRGLGARPIEVPSITTTGPADGGAALARAAENLRRGAYEWVVLTSLNSVTRLFEHLADARAFGSTKVAAIGPGTADALRRRGVVADLVPTLSVSEGLVAAMPAPAVPGGRLLLPRAAVGREVLPEGLRAAGWDVEMVEAYRTQPAVIPSWLLEEAAGADAICFTSASTVSSYLAAARASVVAGGPGSVSDDGAHGEGAPPEGSASWALPRVVATIGPITSQAATEAGISVTVEATEHSLEGLVDALVRVFGTT